MWHFGTLHVPLTEAPDGITVLPVATSSRPSQRVFPQEPGVPYVNVWVAFTEIVHERGVRTRSSRFMAWRFDNDVIMY